MFQRKMSLTKSLPKNCNSANLAHIKAIWVQNYKKKRILANDIYFFLAQVQAFSRSNLGKHDLI
jgi:hypothetical protein